MPRWAIHIYIRYASLGNIYLYNLNESDNQLRTLSGMYVLSGAYIWVLGGRCTHTHAPAGLGSRTFTAKL